MIDPHWLKDKYKNWTDDELHACYRDIAIFGGSELEMAEVSTESERRALAKIQREDEKALFRQEANEEEYNRAEQRKWARNAALHPNHPDKVNFDEPEVEEEE